MRLLILFVCFAGSLAAQPPTDSQLLLNEVRQLRQDLAAATLATQRTQILLYRLQLEESAMARAMQRLDQAKSLRSSLQQRRKGIADQIQAMEDESGRTQGAAQKAPLPQMIAGFKRETENLALQEQDAQAKEIDAESQVRTEQAKRDALEAALDKLDKQLEAATVKQ